MANDELVAASRQVIAALAERVDVVTMKSAFERLKTAADQAEQDDERAALLDHYAGHALTGLLSGGEEWGSGADYVWWAEEAFHLAESMVSRRREHLR